MGAQRTYQKRFERQAGQRLKRSLGDPDEANLPNDFMELLKRADERRRAQDRDRSRSCDRTLPTG